ncbi:probable cytochrome P450 301a1, mitochondrial [Tribolium castaneum]|uniref:Cytochrome P450 334B1 n=1 Tax=Tribolium castaneum TaxID=7070 RepID=D2A1T3_TRICA|nr:PREDICTED: probable cytochrome P450 301a1, mitochondrial [Tribolium castaneum]EFA02864.1 cytochrome P450 334B1 [Tribolium castaneum]|eukprot:XP_971083.1 PREDICTED: probable cytochrome P450 301a1, mitochondrial [Tribolium castaneum]
MSILRGKNSPFCILRRFNNLKNFAHDSTKTSATSASATQAPSPGTFTISGKPSISVPQDTVKVTLQKPDMDVLVDTTTISRQMVAEQISKSIAFDNIPGPISLRIIHRIWGMVPILSTQITGGAIQYFLAVGSLLSWSGNMALFKRFFDHYGPVVRLHGPLGGDIVMVSRPEHIAAVFKNEGPYPIRSSLDSVEKYRLQHRKLRHTGPILMFGPEWENFRKSIEQPLPQLIARQYDKIDDACNKFIARIANIRNRQEEVPGTFQKEIYKWCLECMCLVTLDKKLGFLDPCGLSSTSDPGVLLDGLMKATKAIQRCEYGLHLWQFLPTPAWKSLVENCDAIDNVLSKYVHRIQVLIKEKKEASDGVSKEVNCLMENVLLKPGIMVEDAMTILLDMMLIGINATAHTIAFMLYHLAKNPRCQVKLYNEIARQPKKLSKDALAAMPYLQACIKETLRLKPPIPLLGRILNDDLSIYNYHIPRGTYLLMVTSLSSWREEYFEDAHKFMPERWLTPIDDMQLFASIPFGYGAKACLGKELAEMQIGALITKILRNFKIEYLYGDINSTNKLWAAPNKKLRFRFAERV